MVPARNNPDPRTRHSLVRTSTPPPKKQPTPPSNPADLTPPLFLLSSGPSLPCRHTSLDFPSTLPSPRSRTSTSRSPRSCRRCRCLRRSSGPRGGRARRCLAEEAKGSRDEARSRLSLTQASSTTARERHRTRICSSRSRPSSTVSDPSSAPSLCPDQPDADPDFSLRSSPAAPASWGYLKPASKSDAFSPDPSPKSRSQFILHIVLPPSTVIPWPRPSTAASHPPVPVIPERLEQVVQVHWDWKATAEETIQTQFWKVMDELDILLLAQESIRKSLGRLDLCGITDPELTLSPLVTIDSPPSAARSPSVALAFDPASVPILATRPVDFIPVRDRQASRPSDLLSGPTSPDRHW